jgi:CRISPR-associated protein Cas1
MVVGGFGLTIRVANAHLVIASRDEGEVRLPRVSPLRRLVVVGTSGSISLLALWWCREIGATVTVMEPTGRLLTLSGPEGRQDARLRRAQALAAWTPASLHLARSLNVRKLEGYRTVLAALPLSDRVAPAVAAVDVTLARLRQAETIAAVRMLEADAAIPYHHALATVPVQWRATDIVPDHWRTLGDRGSRLSSSARCATTPGQALRNFVGGLAASEIVAACRIIGLDPGIGIGLHDDVRGRQSLAWEVMEGVRPALDRLTISLLAGRVWRRGDFYELGSGEVRLRPDWPAVKPDAVGRARSLVAEVTRRLLDELRRTAIVAELVEEVATVAAKHAMAPPGSRKTTGINVPTVLSESRRTSARRAETLVAEKSAGAM